MHPARCGGSFVQIEVQTFAALGRSRSRQSGRMRRVPQPGLTSSRARLHYSTRAHSAQAKRFNYRTRVVRPSCSAGGAVPGCRSDCIASASVDSGRSIREARAVAQAALRVSSSPLASRSASNRLDQSDVSLAKRCEPDQKFQHLSGPPFVVD